MRAAMRTTRSGEEEKTRRSQLKRLASKSEFLITNYDGGKIGGNLRTANCPVSRAMVRV